jgi:8-oxo-dGTP pyrophosphatase MutT (NUDIX family)
MSEQYIRKVQTSVTCFLHVGDQYLFLLRRNDAKIDPGKLNGIGGRVEPGENYLAAAIRETKEETGYVVTERDISLSGILRLEGGYDEDWVMCFFRIAVPSEIIPIGTETNDGTLMWIAAPDALTSSHPLVDDLHYCFQDVVDGKHIFFANAIVDQSEKITMFTKTVLPHPSTQ